MYVHNLTIVHDCKNLQTRFSKKQSIWLSGIVSYCIIVLTLSTEGLTATCVAAFGLPNLTRIGDFK